MGAWAFRAGPNVNLRPKRFQEGADLGLPPSIRRPGPRSTLYEAVTAARKQWPTLLVFLDHPELTPDNNGAERRQRPVAQGRRSWMFAGSEGGAESAAVMFSLFGACQLAGVDSNRVRRLLVGKTECLLFPTASEKPRCRTAIVALLRR